MYSFLPMAVVGVSAAAADTLNSGSGATTTGDVTLPLSCSLYLAPSSVQDPDAGWGVFAGVDYDTGDVLGQPTIGVPVVDPVIITYDEGTEKERDAFDMIGAYAYGAVATGGDAEAMRVDMYAPGVGTMANFHSTLFNFVPGGVTISPLLDRSSDHGAGGFTTYHDLACRAKRKIRAGEELFGAVPLGAVPRHIDASSKGAYQKVDALATALVGMQNDDGSGMNENTFVNVMASFRSNIVSKRNDAASLEKLLPHDFAEAVRISEVGSARAALDDRRLEWLQKNGKCLDNIREGISTIPQAGRGAFAARSLAAGAVITPVPLMHLLREFFDVTFPAGAPPGTAAGNKKQLLLNYCFGHSQSGWLFCPTTSAVLINHGGEGGSNAELRWGDGTPGSSGEEFDLTEFLERIEHYNSTQLSFDVVATQEIAEGEEILLDYGGEWEAAWKKHANDWNGGDNDGYESGPAMDSRVDKLSIGADAYPHHSLFCLRKPFSDDSIHDVVEKYSSIIDYSEKSQLLLKLYKDNKFRWWWPCVVKEVHNDNDTLYTVEILEKFPKNLNNTRKLVTTMTHFPRHLIRFVDRPYTSDIHLATGFRHPIAIPDRLFPVHWRDDYRTAQKIVTDTWQEPAVHSRANITDAEHETELRGVKCGLYIAPSTIEGAGNGVYTAVDLPREGMAIGPKLPINAVFNQDTETLRQPWANYEWRKQTFNADFEGLMGMTTSVMSAGLGMMCNFHPGLVNADNGKSINQAILDKYTDVGAGAFSDYHSNYFQTSEAVFAGDEIFISYGEAWLEGRTYLSHVPLWNNYNTGDELVAFLLALANDTGVEDASLESLYALIKDDFIEDDRTSTVLSKIGTVSDMEAVAAAGGTAATTSTRRSTEWLEENGYCIDHIYVKNSTIPQAGKGGFVRRPIKRGDVILPVQLLHVRGGRDVFRRRTDLSDVDRTVIDDKQVFYNYMYSHPDSSVLFMPANAGIVINHGSTRGTTVGAEGKFPNAELKWSTTDRKTQYFLSKAPEDLLSEGYASVVVDFVATRDIAVDEEVLIDYGEEWEEAWNEHVRNWIPPPPTGGVGADGEPLKLSSKAIYDMNQHKFDARHWRWSDDHFSVCEENISEIWEEVHLEDFSKQPRFQQFNITEQHRGFHLASYSTIRTPCLILDSDEGGGTFHVAYFTTKPKKETEKYKLYMVEDLSADKVNFFSIPVRSDSHRSDGHRFSHEIKIPVFPEAWKDMRG